MAETIYTISQIRQINILQSAVADKIYTDEKGNKYVGTSFGTLIFLQKAVTSPIAEIEGIVSKTVQGALSEINGRVSKIENDYVTEEELAAAERRSRCYTLSMSMIL